MSAIETNENLEVVDNEFSQFAPNLNALLKRIFIFLEDGEWDRAYKHCEIVLDQDPENAQAYLGELMAELHVNTMEGLSRCGTPYSDKVFYRAYSN